MFEPYIKNRLLNIHACPCIVTTCASFFEHFDIFLHVHASIVEKNIRMCSCMRQYINVCTREYSVTCDALTRMLGHSDACVYTYIISCVYMRFF